MHRALSITGFKNSGKTTLMLKLIRLLKSRGITVSAVKYSHHGFDRQDSDTGKIGSEALEIAGFAPGETMFSWSRKKYLPDLIPLMSGDVLLVEGGKDLGWLPRILILNSPEQAAELDNGLALATWGRVRTNYLPHAESMDELADILMNRTFMLPGLDCGSCGHDICADLARKIISGDASTDDCRAVSTDLEISINGRILGINPFVQRIITSSITGMLSELKGYSPGRISISIENG